MKAFDLVGFGQSPRIFEVDVSRFARRVGEQHANGHLGTLWIVRRVEVRQILLRGIVERDLALFVELHDGGRGGEGFRQRRHVEDRVLGHRLCRCRRSIQSRLACELARAIRLVEDDLAAMADQNDSARQLVGRYRIVHQLGDGREVGCGSRIRRRRRRGSRNGRGRRRRRSGSLGRLHAFAYVCLRCIATRASRERKQHGYNSDGPWRGIDDPDIEEPSERRWSAGRNPHSSRPVPTAQITARQARICRSLPPCSPTDFPDRTRSSTIRGRGGGPVQARSLVVRDTKPGRCWTAQTAPPRSCHVR